VCLLQLDFDEINLPDPNANVSPDAFFLQLVKAQYGISLEVKAALSLECFFAEVSEEQMAAYDVAIGNVVRTVLKARINPPIANGSAGQRNGNGWTFAVILFSNIIHHARNVV
jgi:hypothetical protein